MRSATRTSIPLVALSATLGAGCYDGGRSDESTAIVVAPPAPASELAIAGPELHVTARPLTEPSATTGRVTAVADLGPRAIAFGAHAIAAVADESVIVSAAVTGPCTSAASVPAADGSGRWGVGTQDGKLVRLRDDRSIEDVGARYGLGTSDHARAVAVLGGDRFVVGIDSGVVLVDVPRASTVRFDVGKVDALATGNDDRVVAMTDGAPWTLDITNGRKASLEASGVRAIAVDGTIAVLATEHAILRETPQRDALHPVLERNDASLTALAISSGRTWYIVGAELWALEGPAARRVASVNAAPGAALAPADNGDVWLLGDVLTHVRPEVPPVEAAWVKSVLPVYQRVCRSCHAPGGSAGIDLSSITSWTDRRAALMTRVLDQRTMPPPPATITEAERDALRAWLTAP